MPSLTKKRSYHKDGLSYHPLYKVWSEMRQRCNTITCHAYERYGGRGITVCDRWDSFKNFLEDMGQLEIVIQGEKGYDHIPNKDKGQY